MAGIYLAVAHNIKIERCIFRGSQVCALDIYQASSNITVRNTNFSYNFITRLVDYQCIGLKITTNNANVSITVLDSSFMGNRHISSSYNLYGLLVKAIAIGTESHLSLTISRTVFVSNSGRAYIFVQTAFVAPIVLSELVFYNNTQQGILFPSLDARDSATLLTISNSSFTNNGNGGIVCAVLSMNTGKKVIYYCG